jgi:hypothetical protein
MNGPSPATTGPGDDDPGDGLTTGQWIEACAQGDRDPDEYGNA